MTFYIVVKENECGRYCIMDSVDTRLHRTLDEAFNQVDKLQPLFDEKLIVVGN